MSKLTPKQLVEARLARFAKSAGVKVEKVDAVDWAGGFAYIEIDSPNCRICGFKTEQAAIRHWFNDRLGKELSTAVMRLIRADAASRLPSKFERKKP